MSETKFTKGKWGVQLEQLRNSKREVFTVVSRDFDVVSTDLCIRNEHDAHLIAAAPEMYEMLKKALKSIPIAGETEEQDNLRFEILDLLEKARGEA